MPSGVALHIGESFAEFSIESSSGFKTKRWFLPQKTPGKALNELLTDFEMPPPEELFVSTKILARILLKRLGSSPAILITAGFEHWPEMNLPVETPFFTITPQRTESPLSRDLIFGVKERVSASGQVLDKIDRDELEFLASKLEMNGIKDVALCFLHSATNAENEKQAEAFLKERGFRVYPSYTHQGTHHTEHSRWWPAVLSAYATPAVQDYLEGVLESIQAEYAGLKVDLKGLRPTSDALEVFSPLESLFKSLTGKYRGEFQRVLYLGIEEFLCFELNENIRSLWHSPFGPVVTSFPPFEYLSVQPTQQIEQGFWGAASIGERNRGFEPGPMCFGRGVEPLVIDIIFANGLLPELEGLSERVSEKTRERILENISTLSKSHSELKINSQEASEFLMKQIRERIAASIDFKPASKTLICGPLASIMKGFSLKAPVEFDVKAETEHFYSTALLEERKS